MISASQRLYDERKRKGLTLEEVSDATKIRVEFLEAIEKGEYGKLPSASYAYGFVRNYAKFLELPEEKTLALFRREFDEKKETKVLPEGLTTKADFPVRRFKISSFVILIIFLFLLLLGYVIFQYRAAIISPPLNVTSPKESSEVSSQILVVTGKTDPASNVFINDEEVSVNSDGTFKKELNVFPGETTVTVRAVDRFGKQTIVTRHIVVK